MTTEDNAIRALVLDLANRALPAEMIPFLSQINPRLLDSTLSPQAGRHDRTSTLSPACHPDF